MKFDLYIKTRVTDLSSRYPMTINSINFPWQVEATKHFATTPVKLSNGKRVWFKHYYKLWNRFIISTKGERILDEIVDENEYLVKLLKDEIHVERSYG